MNDPAVQLADVAAEQVARVWVHLAHSRHHRVQLYRRHLRAPPVRRDGSVPQARAYVQDARARADGRHSTDLPRGKAWVTVLSS
jgi:hypothetical protein